VLALERVGCHAVIEFFDLPGFLAVALGTFTAPEALAQALAMGVFMAALALLPGELRPFVNHLAFFRPVTFRAFRPRVFPVETKTPVLLVIKADVRLPGFDPMAGAAIFQGKWVLKLVHVMFLVAGNAAHLEPHESGLAQPELLFVRLRSFFRMTLDAFQPRVLPHKLITGQRVIEFILVDQGRIVRAPLMLAVALNTGLLCQPVKPRFPLHLLAHFLVAIEAFRIRNSFSRHMTLQTLRGLKIPVTLDHRTRREELVQKPFRLFTRQPLFERV